MASFSDNDLEMVDGRLYLLDTNQYTLTGAKVTTLSAVEEDNTKYLKYGSHKIILDKTIFHPQV